MAENKPKVYKGELKGFDTVQIMVYDDYVILSQKTESNINEIAFPVEQRDELFAKVNQVVSLWHQDKGV